MKIKNSNLKSIGASAALLLSLATTTYAVDVRVSFGGVGDFGDAARWNAFADPDATNELPGYSDQGGNSNAIIQGNVTANVTSNFTPVFDFNPLIVRAGATLNIAADLNIANTDLLYGQSAGTDTITQTAGTVTARNLTVAGGGGVTNTISAGTLSLSGGILLQTGVGSTFSVQGETAIVTAASLTMEAAGATTAPELDFLFGATGVSTIDLTGAFTVGAGSSLTVDGTSYTGGAGMIDLVTFGSNSGTFADPADINLSGFTGFTATVGYDADSMFVTLVPVPEPSSTALLGLGGLALILRRRK